MNFQTMSKQRKFVMIAAAVGLISVFLPWMTSNIFGERISANGFTSYGIIVFLSFAIAGIISLMGDQTKALDQSMWLVVMVVGGLALLFTIIFFTNMSRGFGFTSPGFGLWIALLAAVGVLGSAWMFKNPSDSFKSGFDSLKKSIPVSSTATRNTNTPTTTTTTTNTSGNTNKMAELERLIELKNRGEITEEEYQKLKSKIL